jgi:hypothetical protein
MSRFSARYPGQVALFALISGGLGCIDAETTDDQSAITSSTSQALLAQATTPPDTAAAGAAILGAGPDLAVTSAEYHYYFQTYPEVMPDRPIEIWAKLWRPASLTTRYPLAIFLHGNHGTCGKDGTSPRVDDDCTYTYDGTCPEGYSVIPNHAGYDYIAKDLAAQGYIVVSINANRGITCADGIDGDGNLIKTRGALVLKHLEILSQWNRGEAVPPWSLGVDLQNHLDLSRVSLMGHSRGGEGVRAANYLYNEAGSIWPARIVDPVKFLKIFEIGPTDAWGEPPFNAFNVEQAVLLPMCDGDVDDLQGVRSFDRAMSLFSEVPPRMKATFTVWGANHNYYNTEWQECDWRILLDTPITCVGDGNVPLFQAAPGVTGSAQQQQTGHDSILEFFLTPPGMFDPLNPIPSSISSITRVDRGFTPSRDERITKRLEDFVGEVGTGSYGFPNSSNGIEMYHSTLSQHDSSLRVGNIEWSTASNTTYFQTNFADTGAGIDLRSYSHLNLRVDRGVSNELNLAASTDFSLQLVDDANTLSTALPIANYLSLTGPVGVGEDGFLHNPHSVLQTARIPISAFALSRLHAARGVRLTFNRTASGRIYVANIDATRTTCAATPKLDLKVRQVNRSANDSQFRFQVFNRDSAAVKLSDLGVVMWISDPTTSLASPVYFAGNVVDGSGQFQFTASGTSATTTTVAPACTHAPGRIAGWRIAMSTSDTRSIPGSGGAWVDAILDVHRTDWTSFASYADDFSRLPAYQGGVVSDRTWPNVYGDDPYFVLTYKGMPVATEYLNGTTTDPNSGGEPSCVAKCSQPVGDAGMAAMAELAYAKKMQEPRPVIPAADKPALVKVSAKVERIASASAINASPGGIELEISSETRFPVSNVGPFLRIGELVVSRCRYPGGHKNRRLIFTLKSEQFATLRGGEPMSVTYGGGGLEFDLGKLDLGTLQK